MTARRAGSLLRTLVDQALPCVNDPGIRRRGIGAASNDIQQSGAAATGTVGLAGHKSCEGGVRIAGLREVQLDGTADALPAAPHRCRIDGKFHGNIEQNKSAFRLNGSAVALERMRVGGVEDRLHRPPPFLEVRRSGQ